MNESRLLRIGCVNGQSKRVNERAIDDQWLAYLAESVDLVRISSYAFIKLFGGSFRRWSEQYPASLKETACRLAQLCVQEQLDVIYVNWPELMPYLMAARNYGQLKVSFLLIAHSVGSEQWLKYWISIAPLLQNRDTLLTGTFSCKQALLHISSLYSAAVVIPLCIRLNEVDGLHVCGPAEDNQTPALLSIGRIEDVKNMELLLAAFALIRRHTAGARLIVAGEYTGFHPEQTAYYRQRIEQSVRQLHLEQSVVFTGPVQGAEKEHCFRQADLLINLSTDPGETFGYNLLEAKMRGIPVVCTRWNGFMELVEDGGDGVLIDCEWTGAMPFVDAVHVADACIALLGDPERRRLMSGRAIAQAKKYDYRRLMPIIVNTLEARRSLPSETPPLPSDLLNACPLGSLGHIYNLALLADTGWNGETPLSLLQSPVQYTYPEWMQRVKPIIRHFAH
ncbi:MAG: protein MfpsA [Paenibacillaceae bacterium]|jgi:glycosyltransferase involved in cell wall biosynthesis|nr:protein MfpsA [Paenibacillaceae bacterium]